MFGAAFSLGRAATKAGVAKLESGLSGGDATAEQTDVARLAHILRAILHGRDVLDPETRLDDMLLSLHARLGMTVVMVTHSIVEAAYVGSQVVVSVWQLARLASGMSEAITATLWPLAKQ
jgi:ABC-type proline/glycine betaine transport system ATPase subunit